MHCTCSTTPAGVWALVDVKGKVAPLLLFVSAQQTQFVRFARDVGMTGPDATSEAVTPLLDADVEVAYAAQVNRKNRTGPKRMNYHDFLTAIMKLATRVRGAGGQRRARFTAALWVQ